MTLPCFPHYRCVNLVTKEWFRVSIRFLNNRTSDRITRIAINGMGLSTASFKDFRQFANIYKETPNGLRRMQATPVDDDQSHFFLVETAENLSISEFSGRYKMGQKIMRRNLLRPYRFILKSDVFSVVKKPTLADFHKRREVPKKQTLSYPEIPFQGFIPIDNKKLWAEEHHANSGKRDGSPKNHSDTTRTSVFRSCSEEELAKFNISQKFLNPQEPRPRSVLKTATSPARGLSVHFKSVSEEPRRKETSPEYSPTYSPSYRRKLPETTRKPLSIWALWMKACMAPLGKWGLAVLLLGVAGAILATYASVAFYAASTMTVVGAATVGISLFRIQRSESLKKDHVNGRNRLNTSLDDIAYK